MFSPYLIYPPHLCRILGLIQISLLLCTVRALPALLNHIEPPFFFFKKWAILLDPLLYFSGAFHLYLLNVKYSLLYSNPQNLPLPQRPSTRTRNHSKFNLTLASPHTILKTLNIPKISRQFSSAPTNYLPIQSGLNINPFVPEGSFIMPCSLRGLPVAKGVMRIKVRAFLASHHLRSLTSQIGAKIRSDYVRSRRPFPPLLAWLGFKTVLPALLLERKQLVEGR